MVCQACGNPIEQNASFCSRCGAHVMPSQQGAGQYPPQPQYAAQPPYAPVPAAYPPYPPMIVVPRVQRHLQTLGTLWCIFAAYRLLAGLTGLFFARIFFSRGFGRDWPLRHGMWGWGDGAPWLHLIPVVVTFLVLSALFSAFVGYSLLMRRPWARVLAIVGAILIMLKIPFGTALGIYTLWVLAPAASGAEYDAIAQP